jgi:hypothetical protein
MLRQISEYAASLPEILALNPIGLLCRDVINGSCAQMGSALTCSSFHTFDGALLAIRLQRIPHQECCPFNLQTNEHSSFPNTMSWFVEKASHLLRVIQVLSIMPLGRGLNLQGVLDEEINHRF